MGRRTPIRTLMKTPVAGGSVVVDGWIKTSRFSKNVSFVHLFDGSTPATLQVVLSADLDPGLQARLGIGAAVRVEGRWVASPGAEQAFEVLADRIEVVGDCDPATYPLQKKRTSLEHLRTIAHLRPRTNTFQSVLRVRHQLAWQIHRFFHDRGFLWIHTPILTGSDAEGAGELFQVTTSDGPEAFFGRNTYLSVSGQLEVECFAQSHTDVYTFGPTFRAENSNTPRHASEFWMIEPEMAFANLDDVIGLAEDFVRQIARETIAACPEDFAFFDARIAPGVLASVSAAINQPFARITYTEAQEILKRSGRTFEFPIGWGESLQAEHERFLAEEHFQAPVFVTNYPIEQKAFYMRVDDGERTVAATDLLVPRLGEILGGSQREERLDVLERRMTSLGMHTDALSWYLDLRRWGTTPHGGFGLGFERMLMWLTGIANIRDALPFPRTPGSAEF
ncbi:MAG: asparagine--tRNA ligase [Deltaproteobacteria bacterium]|nr:asparagine--tRNA ligase [Deltaproteobacteria bacterium]